MNFLKTILLAVLVVVPSVSLAQTASTSIRALPDLVVRSFTPPATVGVNMPLDLSAVVGNIGTAIVDQPFYVGFLIKDSEGIVTSETNPMFLTTDGRIASVSWTPTATGSYAVSACADYHGVGSAGSIEELDESNNCRKASVVVLPSYSSYSCIELTKNMVLNSTDLGTVGDVTRLQAFLNGAGYLEEVPTGYFKTSTLAALQQFQSQVMGMATTTLGYGKVGPVTRAKIKEISCANQAPIPKGLNPITVQTLSQLDGYKLVAAGTSGVLVNTLEFKGTNESVNLSHISLAVHMTSLLDAKIIKRVHVWDGSKWVGSALVPQGFNTPIAFDVKLSSVVVVPKNEAKTLKITVDLEPSVGDDVRENMFKVRNWSTNFTIGGVGVESGRTVGVQGETLGTSVHVYKTLPKFGLEKGQLNLVKGKFMKFKVSANKNGSVSLKKLTFKVATSSQATVRSMNLYAYTDASYSVPVEGFYAGGRILSSDVTVDGNNPVSISPAEGNIVIPAGSTYFFELRGSVDTVPGASITTTLLGDSPNGWISAKEADFAERATSNFVWSPNTKSIAVTTDTDWVDGAWLPSLPESGLSQKSVRATTTQSASVIGAFSVDTPTESESVPTSTFAHTWNNNLQIGTSRADDVVALQSVLKEEGLFAGEITGGFYNQTYLAVKAFQASYGIESTGFVGPVTREKLNSLYGASN